MYDVIIGHYGEDKSIPFGVKNYRIELKICTLVEDPKLYNIYSGFLKILDFVIIFLKKVIFWNFWGQKTFFFKFQKSEIAIL